MMHILIDNVGFVNKGAELMLCSIVEKLKQQYPEAQLLIPYRLYIQGGFEYCSENNIMPVKYGCLSKLESLFYKLCIKMGLMSSRSLRLFIHASQIDLVIDASGFSFGDQWKHNSKTTRRVKKYYNSFKKGYKLVFLPQSFGPFEKKDSINTVNAALEHAGLVYAREDISLNYLMSVAKNRNTIHFNRDFTILHKYDTYLSDLLKHKDYVTIIPNKKMITHSSLQDGAYLVFICNIIKELHERGENIYLLNHEGVGDKRICEQINSHLKLNLPILSGLKAMEVKNVIGNSKMVISSRFHGVVSGIVQKVPTFCTSWSHKYNELLAVYGIENNLLEVDSFEQSKKKLVDSLDNPSNYITNEDKLAKERESINLMWSEIFKYIED